jgi:putative drug exporter of the RND superfamily
MRRLADLATRHPVRVLLAWLAVLAVVTTLTSPAGIVQQSDVMKSDPSAFLPQRYESARAARLEQQAFPHPKGAPATLVVRRADRRPLTGADVRRVGALSARVAETDGVRALVVGRTGLSANRRVLLGSVLFDKTVFDPTIARDVERLRDRTAERFSHSGLVAGYTGDAPTQADAQSRDTITNALTMIVILALLVVLFRSVVLAFVDVVLVALVGAMASGMLVIAAKVFGFPLSTNATGLLPIVVLGVGTDYVVFLLVRYREHLREGQEPREAMRRAIRRIGPAIGFSALAVVVSLSALLLSSMQSFKVLGPALGFGVLSTLVAALTLVPAVAVLLRGKLFWPSRRYADTSATPSSTRTARLVTRTPLGAFAAAAAILVALAIPAVGFTPNYNQQQTVPGSASERAFDDLKAGFPQGALQPTKVIIRSDAAAPLSAPAIARVSSALRRSDGIGDVLPAVVSRDGRTAELQALLSVEPFTARALRIMEHDIRPAVAAAAAPRTTVAVGGNTSAYADVRKAINHDQTIIFPIAAALVGVILMVLLRSLVVPLVVMTGVALGFAATLGAAVVAFQGIGGAAGLNFSLPLVVYLFVASMTSDYAILILARVREEIAAGRTPREAASIALATAGPSVFAAGVVLAGSFGVLVISPSLGQIGFAIATGILLSSMLTARVLIPALTVLAGRRAWWPARLGERHEHGRIAGEAAPAHSR